MEYSDGSIVQAGDIVKDEVAGQGTVDSAWMGEVVVVWDKGGDSTYSEAEVAKHLTLLVPADEQEDDE